MGGVARRAHRGHREPLLIEPDAVDGLGVVGEDAVLGDVVLDLDRRTLVVAPAAQHRHVHDVGGRVRAGVRQHVVPPVAVDARRRQPLAARQRLAVDALGVLLVLDAVAAPALDALEPCRMRKLDVLEILVAGGALEPGMRRAAQRSGVVARRMIGVARALRGPRLVAHRAGFGARERLGLGCRRSGPQRGGREQQRRQQDARHHQAPGVRSHQLLPGSGSRMSRALWIAAVASPWVIDHLALTRLMPCRRIPPARRGRLWDANPRS